MHVHRALGLSRLAKLRGCVEGHIVIEKLPEERETGSPRGIVPIVRTQFRIRDETDRAFVQWVLGVHQPAGRTELGERGLDPRRWVRERRQIEHAAESVGGSRHSRSIPLRETFQRSKRCPHRASRNAREKAAPRDIRNPRQTFLVSFHTQPPFVLAADVSRSIGRERPCRLSYRRSSTTNSSWADSQCTESPYVRSPSFLNCFVPDFRL